MEILIKRKDFPAIIEIIKSSKLEKDLLIFSKHLEESDSFRIVLIEYLKTSSKYHDLIKLIQILVDPFTQNLNLNKLILTCEIIEILIFDYESKYKNNIFLQSILLSCVIHIYYEDKKQTFKERLVQIFLKIKILSKDEITILEKIQLFYLLGFYYYKNTTEYESALDCFLKAGLVDTDPIIAEIKSFIQHKNQSNNNEIDRNSGIDNTNNSNTIDPIAEEYSNLINSSENICDSNIGDNNLSNAFSAGHDTKKLDKDNYSLNNELSLIEANTEMEIEHPEDFDAIDVSPFLSGNKPVKSKARESK